MSSSDLSREEGASFSGGCEAAIELMNSESAKALHRCHCAGGVLICIDQGCALIGRRAAPKAQRVFSFFKKQAASLEAAAGEPPPPWPSLLPFAIGLPPAHLPATATAASERPAWRRLRGGASRLNLPNCSLGFCALGLPHGTALTTLSDKRFATRGSARGVPPRRQQRRGRWWCASRAQWPRGDGGGGMVGRC